MKRLCALAMLLCFILCGCGAQADGMTRALSIRQQVLDAKGFQFEAEVAADFGDNTYTFVMQCQCQTGGKFSFAVLQPDTIAGISGTISNEGGKLVFDDKALAFPLIADGEVSPVSAPWLLMRTIQSGYIATAAVEDDLLHLQIDDSYAEDALQLDIWFNDQDQPVHGDIMWQGRRILSVSIKAFAFV